MRDNFLRGYACDESQLSSAREDTLAKHGSHELLYQGRGKNLYRIDRPEFLIQELKNAGSVDGKKKTKSGGIGTLRNDISSYLFEYLEGFHIWDKPPGFRVNRDVFRIDRPGAEEMMAELRDRIQRRKQHG